MRILYHVIIKPNRTETEQVKEAELAKENRINLEECEGNKFSASWSMEVGQTNRPTDGLTEGRAHWEVSLPIRGRMSFREMLLICKY